MSINYKSDDGLSRLEQCAYFWNEKGDPTRYVDFESCAERLPEIVRYWEDYKMKIKLAELEYEMKMQSIIDHHDPKAWGN